jgi:predicted transcriptional regulator
MQQFTFGKKLEYYRDLVGISKKELGDTIGTTGEYVALIETGKTKPPRFEIIQKIIKKLELSEKEKEQFLKLAFEERLSANDLELYNEIERINGL